MTASFSPHPRFRLYGRAGRCRLLLRAALGNRAQEHDAPERLEREICRRFEVEAAVCMPMARTGLYFALLETIRPGQTVVLSPLTIVDVVNAVVLAGGVPVFCDILRETCGLDPARAEEAIDHRTGAVLLTHLHGENAGAAVFRELCRRRGVPLIEDAAQSFGAMDGGRHLGTIGDVGIYSFGLYKNVTAWQGGMLVSRDRNLISRIRRRIEALPAASRPGLVAAGLRGAMTDLATWPPVFALFTYPVVRQGILRGNRLVRRMLDPESGAVRVAAFPNRCLRCMTGLQASMVLRQLDALENGHVSRLQHAVRYREALSGIEKLILPRRAEGLSNIHTTYPIQTPEREALLRYAQRGRCDIAPQHLRNIADLPAFAEFHRDCPNARAAARELALLPTYPGYPESEVVRNIQVVREFFDV